MSREERKPVKFTNVKYYRGGSKTPLRLRFNQNRTFYLRNPEDYTYEELVDRLYYLTRGTIVPSMTTKVKRLYLSYDKA